MSHQLLTTHPKITNATPYNDVIDLPRKGGEGQTCLANPKDIDSYGTLHMQAQTASGNSG